MNSLSPEQLSKRAILAPLNIDVRALNKTILDSLPGQCHEYFSLDEELDYDGETLYLIFYQKFSTQLIDLDYHSTT
jgi:hypothetical protein